jgi:diguanylate cyclase (GGDEF)-like protein
MDHGPSMRLRLSRNLVILIWFAFVAASAGVNLQEWHRHFRQMGLQAAEGLAQLAVITDHWNAGHGTARVSVTDGTQATSGPTVPERDIGGSHSEQLTRTNPAHMIPQLAELVAAQTGVRFHITSRDPLRPHNAPTAREARYLERFANDPRAAGEVLDTPDGRTFFYMAPLITDASCLHCHAQQGFRVGDVSGGISVEVPYARNHAELAILLSHGGLLLVGLLGVLWFFSRLSLYVNSVEHEAGQDALTGVLNRKAFMAILDSECRRSRRSGQPLALLMIDVDNFRHINDARGQPAGDRCLQALVELIAPVAARAGDALGRYGGEEFAILLPCTALDDALLVAERMRAAVENHIVTTADGDPLHMTVSIGVAVREGNENTPGELIGRADDALYQAKRRGKNRISSA